MRALILFPILTLATLPLSHSLPAAEAPPTLMDIARETSDPTGDLWFFSTEFATSFEPDKPYRSAHQFTCELQPTLPVPLTPDWRLLNFPDLVLATEGTADGTQVTGVESFNWLAAFSPVAGSTGISWGLGPYVSLPVSTSAHLAASQWQTGAGGVLAWRTPKSVLSVQVHSGWTTAGSGSIAQSIEIQTNAQYFFQNGMQVGLGHPRIEYTRNHDGSGGWDVPVGVNVARTFHVGKMPVKVMLEYDLYVMNDSRWQPEHLFRLTILPVIPSPFKVPIFN